MAGALRFEEVAREAGGIENGADAVAIAHCTALARRGIEEKDVLDETDSKAPYNAKAEHRPRETMWPF